MPSLHGERILVTGGAGFIGSHLVDILRSERAADVVVLDNLESQTHPSGRPSWVPADIAFYQGDVRSIDDLARALRGVRYVFHIAGYGGFVPDVSKYMDVNATGTIRLYEALRDHGKDVRKVVVASSQGIYGEGLYRDRAGQAHPVGMRPLSTFERGEWEHHSPTREPLRPSPTPETHPHNSLNIYSISKYAEERAALALGNLLKVPTCCLRYALTYGPRQSLHNPYTGVVAIFSTQIVNDVAPLPYEDGQQTRDFLYVADNVRGNLVAMERDETAGQVLNVGTGVATTIDHLARTLASLYDKPRLEPVYRGSYRPGDVRHLVLDPSALIALGWRPETTLDQGMRQFVTWVRTNEQVPDLFRTAEQNLIASGVVRQSGK